MHIRSSPFSLLPEPLDDAHYLLAPVARIHSGASEAHADFFRRVGHQQPFQEQLAHVQAYEDAAVTAVLLDRRVVEVDVA